MLQLIADRAYELFEGAGRIHGHDLQHWLQAEAELCDRTTLNIIESRRLLVVLALVPGFAASELLVDLERSGSPSWAIRISYGSPRDRGRSGTPFRRQRLFRTSPLPVEIWNCL
jgi:Protein of unknown function (DUF2934)